MNGDVLAALKMALDVALDDLNFETARSILDTMERHAKPGGGGEKKVTQPARRSVGDGASVPDGWEPHPRRASGRVLLHLSEGKSAGRNTNEIAEDMGEVVGTVSSAVSMLVGGGYAERSKSGGPVTITKKGVAYAKSMTQSRIV